MKDKSLEKSIARGLRGLVEISAKCFFHPVGMYRLGKRMMEAKAIRGDLGNFEKRFMKYAGLPMLISMDIAKYAVYGIMIRDYVLPRLL